MARPQKIGLDYFPFDTDLFQDEKIVALSGEFGLKGQITVIRLLCEIYRNGYYLEWNSLVSYKMLSLLPGVDAAELNAIVGRLVEWGFFSERIFQTDGVLTSVAIQERYFEIVKKRRKPASLPHLLVEVALPAAGSAAQSEAETEFLPTKPELTPQIKGNEIKRNKTKISLEGDAKANCGAKAAFTAPSLVEIESFIREEQLEVDAARFYNYHASKGWKVGNSPMVSWQAAVRTWHARGDAGFNSTAATGQKRVVSGAVKTDMRILAEAEARHAREAAAEACAAPPLKPSEWKRRRGLTADEPLVQTFQLGTAR